MADRSVVVRLQAAVGNYLAAMNQARVATKELRQEVATTATTSKADMEKVGMAMTVAGGAIVAGVGLATKAFADFDEQMSAVGAVAQTTAGNMDRLRQAAIDAGADTAFSASEAARAQEELVKAGISVEDVLGGALAGALDLAAAGELQLADAATIAAQAMNVFKLGGQDVTHIADVLAASANKSAADVADLGQGLRQGGLVAAQTGLSLEETAAALSLFSDNALVGSDAGTSLKTMLQRLTPQSKEAAQLMGELGFSAYDAQGNFIGLDGLAQELQTSLGDMTVEQRNAAMAVLFGSDAVRGANVLLEAGADKVREYVDAVDDQGAAAEMAAAKLDNLKGDLEELGGSIETALINSGSAGNTVLRELVQLGTGAVNVYNDLPGPVQATATGLGALAGSASLAAGGFLLAAPRIAETKTALSNLATSMPRTVGALRAVGSVLTGPWGIALAGGIAAVGLFAKVHADAQQRIDDVIATLDAETGALTENTDAWLARELQASRAFDFGRRLGLSMGDVIDAAEGEAEALDRVNAAIDANIGKHGPAGEAADKLGGIIGRTNAALEDGQSVWRERNVALAESEGRYFDVAHAIEAGLTPAEASARIQMQALADAAGPAAGGIEDVGEAAEEAVDPVRAFSDALDRVLGVFLSVAEAEIGWEQAFDDLKEAVKENGTELDRTSEKGRELESTIIDGIRAAMDHGQALMDEGRGAEEAAAAVANHIDQLRDELIELGLAEDAVDELLASYNATPDQIYTRIIAQTAEAEQALDRLAAKLSRVTGTGYVRVVGGDTVVPRGVTRHDGGWADWTGRRHTGPLRGDEVPAVLQHGEFVLNAADAAVFDGYGLLPTGGRTAQDVIGGARDGRTPAMSVPLPTPAAAAGGTTYSRTVKFGEGAVQVVAADARRAGAEAIWQADRLGREMNG